MNVSYKPKDHNVEVPAYSLNLLPSNDLHNYLFYFQSSNYYIVTHKNIAVVFSHKK